MKDMTSVASTMMTDEEKAEIEKQLNSDGTNPSTPVAGAPAHVDASSTKAAGTASSSRPQTPPAAPSPTSAVPQHPTSVPTTPIRPDAPHQHSSLIPHGDASANSVSPSPSDKEREKERQKEAARKRNKISQEQKEKLREQERERRKVMEARVAMLTSKMIERLRPFVEAKYPGEKDDPETVAFEKKMKREADDLKLESFGVEVCGQHAWQRLYAQLICSCSQLLHAIGHVYMMKASSFMKSRKFLGMYVFPSFMCLT